MFQICHQHCTTKKNIYCPCESIYYETVLAKFSSLFYVVLFFKTSSKFFVTLEVLIRDMAGIICIHIDFHTAYFNPNIRKLCVYDFLYLIVLTIIVDRIYLVLDKNNESWALALNIL